MKKSRWATPAGIDHDYNYLKNVERTIDDASQSAHQRGIGLETRTSKSTTRAWHPESALTRYLRQNHITVDHAPMGMSRQKTNQTRTTKSAKIVWTVEWINESGECDVQNDCVESASLEEIYSALRMAKRNAEKRRLSSRDKTHTNQRGVKRKHEQNNEETRQTLDERLQCQEEDFLQRIESGDHQHRLKSAKAEHDDGVHLQHQPAGDVEDASESACALSLQRDAVTESVYAPEDDIPSVKSVRTSAPSSLKPSTDYLEKDASSDGSSSPVQFILDVESEPAPLMQLETPVASQQATSPHNDLNQRPEHFFYLLKPGTKSASRVVIPLKSEASLTESLRHQILQEYPTIYVLPGPPDPLGAGFLLEKDYLKAIPTEAEGIVNQPSVATKANGVALGVQRHNLVDHDGDLDAKSILAMLKRDITV